MPELGDPIHLRHLEKRKKEGELYGLHWGDPEKTPRLAWVRDTFCLPYIDPNGVAVEIGPGGGRWTRYLKDFGKLYAVDFHKELLDELAENFTEPNIVPIQNSGTDLPGIEADSVDFVFSYGVFVHLEQDVIDAYLAEIHRVLRPETGRALIQYSDKTKGAAKHSSGFSQNTPDDMRRLLRKNGLWIEHENLTALDHSSIVLFSKRTDLDYPKWRRRKRQEAQAAKAGNAGKAGKRAKRAKPAKRRAPEKQQSRLKRLLTLGRK